MGWGVGGSFAKTSPTFPHDKLLVFGKTSSLVERLCFHMAVCRILFYMARVMTPEEGSRMAKLRDKLQCKGGRPPKETKCPRCGYKLPSYRAAMGHCVGLGK